MSIAPRILRETIWSEDVARLQRLLAAGADANSQVEGTPALLDAVETLNEVVLRVLLDAGASVDSVDTDGVSALSLASFLGLPGMVDLLLAKGGSANIADSDGCTPLMNAAKVGANDVLRLLLQRGAKVDAVDRDNQTALSWCAMRGDFPEAAQSLLDAGASANHIGGPRYWSPLMCATALGHPGVVAVLLRAGADRQLAGMDGETVTSLAKASGNRIIQKLLEDSD